MPIQYIWNTQINIQPLIEKSDTFYRYKWVIKLVKNGRNLFLVELDSKNLDNKDSLIRQICPSPLKCARNTQYQKYLYKTHKTVYVKSVATPIGARANLKIATTHLWLFVSQWV